MSLLPWRTTSTQLYWGSACGLKTFFARRADWAQVTCGAKPRTQFFERCVFKHRTANVYLIADAYRGIGMRRAILDFLDSAAGDGAETLSLRPASGVMELPIGGGANLVA